MLCRAALYYLVSCGVVWRCVAGVGVVVQGMVVSVGRIRQCPLFSFKFVCLSHNTVIGAAGGSIQNAELALAKHLL